MVNYFEVITRGNSDQLLAALVERFPDLGDGSIKVNYWEKDGSVKRFYFNAKDGGTDKSFNVNIKERTVFVNDYEEPFWEPILGVNADDFREEFKKLVEDTLSMSY